MDGNTKHRPADKFSIYKTELENDRHDNNDHIHKLSTKNDPIRIVVAAYEALPKREEIQIFLKVSHAYIVS